MQGSTKFRIMSVMLTGQGLQRYNRMIRLFFLLIAVASVDGFSEHLEAAEEEHQFDDRTLLDVFGERAKEVLTKHLVRNQSYDATESVFPELNIFRSLIQTRSADGTGDMHAVSQTAIVH